MQGVKLKKNFRVRSKRISEKAARRMKDASAGREVE
jgi:hypothetical protein